MSRPDKTQVPIVIRFDPTSIKMIKWCAVKKGFNTDDNFDFKDIESREKIFSKFCEEVLLDYSKKYHKQLKEQSNEEEKYNL